MMTQAKTAQAAAVPTTEREKTKHNTGESTLVTIQTLRTWTHPGMMMMHDEIITDKIKELHGEDPT